MIFPPHSLNQEINTRIQLLETSVNQLQSESGQSATVNPVSNLKSNTTTITIEFGYFINR